MKVKPRTFHPASEAEALRYLTHCANARLVVCGSCVRSSDLTVQSYCGAVGVCARCRRDFPRFQRVVGPPSALRWEEGRGAWEVVPAFACAVA